MERGRAGGGVMRRSGGVSGAVSLVMIFCVLCLAVFSVLTLATADREAKLSEMTARNAAEYYRADYTATAIAAALSGGGPLPADVDVAWDGDTASFRLPIGESLGLDVALSVHGDGSYEVLRWQTVYTGSWEPSGYLELWGRT